MKLHIQFCCPEYKNEHGGVQQFSYLLAQALKHSPLTGTFEEVSFPSPSTTNEKLRFLSRFAGGALQHPDLCIFTHVGLARIAPLLHFLNIPYWICAHGIECWSLRRSSEAQAFLGAERVLCVSRHTRNRLVHNLPGLAHRCDLLPNHVESIPAHLTPKDDARRRLGLALDTVLILTVSRLRDDRYKGHREILSALQALGPSASHVHYAIVGDGIDLVALRKEAADRQLTPRIHFLGSLSDDQRALAYDACDAFVMPSTGEGFGIVFLEAMAHGKPILAGSVDGSVDAFDGHDCGILVNPRNPAAVALALSELLRRLHQPPPGWSSDALRLHVQNHFGPERQHQRINALLQAFIQRSSPCAA